MEIKEFRERGKEMIDDIADMLQNIDQRPVVPDVKPGFLIDQLPEDAPHEGESWDRIRADVRDLILPGTVWWQHPGFHAFFPTSSSLPSILGELLSASLGGVCFSWAAAPAATELELVVLDWMGRALGLPDEFLNSSGKGGGVIQGGASESVLVAMLVARKQAFNDYHFSEAGKLVAYCSTLTHSSVEKAASVCNVQIRKLKPDHETWSIRGNDLKNAIAEDRAANLIPFFVCATIGTTSIVSCDNMKEMGEALEGERGKIWLHVDGAYGGNALICPEYQHLLLSGIQVVDSVMFNVNKGILVNFDAAMMYTRNREKIESALSNDPLYLQHGNQHLTRDFRNWSLALSRRNRALKVWFVIRTYGISGLQENLRRNFKIAKNFTMFLQTNSRFEQIGNTLMGLVAFRLKGDNSLSERLLGLVNTRGGMYITPAEVAGKYVIRYVVTEHTIEDRVEFEWKVFARCADLVLSGDVIETSLDVSEMTPADLATIRMDTSESAATNADQNPVPRKQPMLRRYSTECDVISTVLENCQNGNTEH